MIARSTDAISGRLSLRKKEISRQWHLLKFLEFVIAASEPQSSALWMPAVRRFGQARDDDDFGLK